MDIFIPNSIFGQKLNKSVHSAMPSARYFSVLHFISRLCILKSEIIMLLASKVAIHVMVELRARESRNEEISLVINMEPSSTL